MLIEQAIRAAMRSSGMTYANVARIVWGKPDAGRVSACFASSKGNMKMQTALTLLDSIGYEMVIQEKRGGQRRADQIVVTKEAPQNE